MKKAQDEKKNGFTRRDFLRVSAGMAGVVALGSLPALASAEKSGGPASDDIVDALLRGAIDTHIHGGPDVMPRKLSDIGIAQAAKAAGMKAVITKCHVTSTTSRAILAQEAVGQGILIFGGLALNKAEGGLNPAAVETEIKIGAKEIWLPTFWSESHIKFDKKNPADAVKLTDDKGAFRPELIEIFDLIAKKDIILGTGHTTPEEMERFIPLAIQRGVKKILITHPEWLLPNMSIEDQKKLVRFGVYFERCAQSLYPPPNRNLLPQAYVEQIKATGAECSTLATDLGQVYNPEPVAGLRHFIKTLLANGISSNDIEIMAKRNPAQLLGV